MEADIPATKALALFVATCTTDQLTPTLRTKIKEVLIDYVGVVVGGLANADSTDSIYKAICVLQGPDNTGPCTVIGKGPASMLPQYAGLLNSAFGHSLDFDDTFAEGTLHAGVTAISAAMSQAEVLGDAASIDTFMLAIAVGYEVTCRLGRELGMDAYHRGFHNTSTAGIFGAIAAIAVVKNLSAEVVEMAFGLAGSKAAGSMQYLDNGSWNKRLHPGFAVHDAFMCVSLAEAGVIGATRIIEGKYGFLQAYSPKPDKSLPRLVRGLGTEWIWLASSLKPYPACRMTHTLIELAGNVHASRKVVSADISEIELRIPHVNMLLVGDATPNKIHPSNHIDAQFSAYFQVANALLYGPITGIEAYKKLSDPEIVALCSKTIVIGDEQLDVFAGRLRIQWADGRIDATELQHPLGEAQHPFTRSNVDQKFLSLTVPTFGPDRTQRILGTIDLLEQHTLVGLLSLLR